MSYEVDVLGLGYHYGGTKFRIRMTLWALCLYPWCTRLGDWFHNGQCTLLFRGNELHLGQVLCGKTEKNTDSFILRLFHSRYPSTRIMNDIIP